MRDYKHYPFQTVEEAETELKQERSLRTMVRVSVAGAVAVALTGLLMFQCTEAVVKSAENQERYYSAPVQFTAEQEEYRSFFARHGSPQPEAMAMAVTATKNPPLMAALAVVESNADPSAVGDGGESLGAFQVQPKYHGAVSASPVQQALQAERILEEIVQASRGRLRQGLARYNGGSNPPPVSDRYAVKVLRLAGVR